MRNCYRGIVWDAVYGIIWQTDGFGTSLEGGKPETVTASHHSMDICSIWTKIFWVDTVEETFSHVTSLDVVHVLLSSKSLVQVNDIWLFNPRTRSAHLLYYLESIHPASRGVAAHTASLFRSVRGAKGGFPPWGLPKLRIFTSPPREGSPSEGIFTFPRRDSFPSYGIFTFPSFGGSPSCGISNS